MPKRSVPDALLDLSNLYAERNKQYGDDYKLHGHIMVALFPEGVDLSTPAEFNRYSCLKEIVTKIARYANNFSKGGHKDSLDDITVYAQMLQELDHER